jgi:hypothetical protein
VKLISFKQPTVAVFCFECWDISFKRRQRNRKITTSFVVFFSLSRTVIRNRQRSFSTPNLPRGLPQVVSLLTCTREIHSSNFNRDINNSGWKSLRSVTSNAGIMSRQLYLHSSHTFSSCDACLSRKRGTLLYLVPFLIFNSLFTLFLRSTPYSLGYSEAISFVMCMRW